LQDIAAKSGELSTVFFFPLIPGVKVWHRQKTKVSGVGFQVSAQLMVMGGIRIWM